MSLLKKMDSVMFKIFQIMNKINKFSNQMTELTPSPDYGRKKQKEKTNTKNILINLSKRKKDFR